MTDPNVLSTSAVDMIIKLVYVALNLNIIQDNISMLKIKRGRYRLNDISVVTYSLFMHLITTENIAHYIDYIFYFTTFS